MDILNMFEYIKTCLKEFQYPNIEIMRDDELQKIFIKINREFLVTWIFQKLNRTYGEVIESYGTEKSNFLADLVHSHGFCTQSQKSHFINATMENSEQLKIFYRMFKFLENTRSMRENDDAKLLSASSEDVPNIEDEMQNLIDMDLNLFPMYGPIREREDANEDDPIMEVQILEDCRELTDRVLDVADRFVQIFPDLKQRLNLLSNQLGEVDTKSTINLNPELEELLLKFHKNRQTILKYIENCKIIKNSIGTNLFWLDVDLKNDQQFGIFYEINQYVLEISDIIKSTENNSTF